MKKSLFAIPLLCLFFAGTSPKQPARALAEDVPTVTESTEAVSSEPESVVVSVEEPVVEEEQQGFIKKAYYTYVVPLLASVSLGNILSSLSTIGFLIYKSKKLKKDSDEMKANNEQLLQKLQEVLVRFVELYDSILQSLRDIKDCMIDIVKDKELTKLMEREVKEALAEIKKSVFANARDVGKINKLEKVCTALCQLEMKVASQDRNAISSGIMEDINLIKKLLAEN